MTIEEHIFCCCCNTEITKEAFTKFIGSNKVVYCQNCAIANGLI